MEPTEKDLASSEFEAVWQAIKDWDIQREEGVGYAHATGTDVMTILNSLRSVEKPVEVSTKKLLNLNISTPIEEAVYTAIGAATVCWENLSGSGLFQSDRAKQIGDELIEYFNSKQPIY